MKYELRTVSLNVYTTVSDEQYPLICEILSEANDAFVECGLVEDSIEEWLDCDLYGKGLTIKPSRRLTSTLGYCKSMAHETEITLQEGLIDYRFYDDLKSVFYHELIHMLYPRDGHRGRFIDAMNKLNQYDPTLNITTKYDCRKHEYQGRQPKQRTEYILRCKKCGNEIHYQRKTKAVKYPEFYSCAHCHGKIERIK